MSKLAIYSRGRRLLEGEVLRSLLLHHRTIEGALVRREEASVKPRIMWREERSGEIP